MGMLSETFMRCAGGDKNALNVTKFQKRKQ